MGPFGFDFDMDGEVSIGESAMTMAILDQMMREEDEEDFEDEEDEEDDD